MVILIGSKALTMQSGANSLPVFLDDLRCNGMEHNLLECLPHHNCHGDMENAAVLCLLRGTLSSYNN